ELQKPERGATARRPTARDQYVHIVRHPVRTCHRLLTAGKVAVDCVPMTASGPGPCQTTEDRAALRWLFGFVRPHGRRLALVVAVALLSTLLVLLQPLLTKFLIDDGILAGDFRTVVLLCAAMLAVAL